MVRFDTNPERYNTVKMLRHLETDVENLISLDNHISTMEEEIRVNPKFVKIHGNTGSSGGMGGRGGAVSAEIDDEIILPSAGRGSRSGSLGPSSSSNVNSNNFNFTCWKIPPIIFFMLIILWRIKDYDTNTFSDFNYCVGK